MHQKQRKKPDNTLHVYHEDDSKTVHEQLQRWRYTDKQETKLHRESGNKGNIFPTIPPGAHVILWFVPMGSALCAIVLLGMFVR